MTNDIMTRAGGYLFCQASQHGLLQHHILLDDTPTECDKVLAEMLIDLLPADAQLFKGEDITASDMRKILD